jgi:hypothetical protein
LLELLDCKYYSVNNIYIYIYILFLDTNVIRHNNLCSLCNIMNKQSIRSLYICHLKQWAGGTNESVPGLGSKSRIGMYINVHQCQCWGMVPMKYVLMYLCILGLRPKSGSDILIWWVERWWRGGEDKKGITKKLLQPSQNLTHYPVICHISSVMFAGHKCNGNNQEIRSWKQSWCIETQNVAIFTLLSKLPWNCQNNYQYFSD